MQNNEQNYEDIIHMTHPTSKNHSRMAAIDRAAQFSPFAALTGYEAEVKEAARLTDRRVELDEYEKMELDRRFQILREHLSDRAEVTFTCFVPDDRKKGGTYVTLSGCVKKIDDYEHRIVLTDGRKIDLKEVASMESLLFR